MVGCGVADMLGGRGCITFFVLLILLILFCRDQPLHEYPSFVWWALPLVIVLVTMKSSINTPL